MDLVRFVAALSVVLYHYTARAESNSFELLSNVTQFGYLGVPVFFIISGFVIALSANNRSAFEFAVSRFVRLYPAYWICMLFTVLIATSYGTRDYSVAQIFSNATLLNEYFGFSNVDGIYWTLKAELKFYACIFVLLLFDAFRHIRLWLSIWLVITATYLIANQPFFMGVFISPYFSSYFISGIAFYLLHKEGKNVYNLFILISSFIISIFYTFSRTSEYIPSADFFDQYISVAVLTIFYTLFYLLVTGKIYLRKHNFYLTLGGLTYPLYLLHNVAGITIIDKYSDLISEEVLVTIIVVLMLFLSWLIHLGVEKRFATPIKVVLLKKLGAISFLKHDSNKQ